MFIGIIGSTLLFLPAILNQISSCYQKNLFFCSDSYEVNTISILPLLPIFILSLITYKMQDEVFRAWWGFARWWVPVIIAVTLFLQNAGGGGGWGLGSGGFDILILSIFYAIFVITSLVKIVRAYLKTR